MKEKISQITVSGVPILLVRKDVKNLNMRVKRSTGVVRVSCPRRLPERVVRSFIMTKMEWIQKHLSAFKKQKPQPVLTYSSGESHFFKGKPYTLQVVYYSAVPEVNLVEENKIELFVRPGSGRGKREKVMKEWYRSQLKTEICLLIKKWEPVMGVKVNEFGVKQMKTRWGTCNIRAGRLWLNLELAKKTPECLESVVVHEMVHLLERLHNKRFYRLMGQFLPDWRERERDLTSQHRCNNQVR
ncbi:MAG: SprT family zinc-dependent metalloprotease [Balneolaceae bacterium]